MHTWLGFTKGRCCSNISAVPVMASHVCIRYGEPIYIKELPAEKRKFPGAYTRDVIEGMLKEMKEEQEQDK